MGGGGIAADAGTNNCRAVDRESYPEYIRTVNSVSLISEAAREELEVLALHGEAAHKDKIQIPRAAISPVKNGTVDPCKAVYFIFFALVNLCRVPSSTRTRTD